MLERQKNLSEAYVEAAGRNIQEQTFSSELYKKAENIFVYISTKKEPDTFALIQRAFGENKKVYVPKCTENNMSAVRIHDIKNLTEGKLGILEPEDCLEKISAEELDIIIVPCLSASLNGKRLGHGRGYYDKFLSGHNEKTICLCFRKMLYDEIPMTENDVYMSLVLTENF